MPEVQSRWRAVSLAVVFLVVILARFAHLEVLWAEEAYPTAAARELLAGTGKVLYRDVWFDKPPLYAFAYLLWDAQTGFGLRWSGALYVILAASLAYRFALDRWGRDEALAAASMLALYLTFGIPSAVMALAPDLLLVAPHLGAVYLAWKGRAFWAGLVAGLGFAANAKGALVLLVCLLWQWRRTHMLAAGFAVPAGLLALYLADNRAWGEYVRQAWTWNFRYAADTFVERPLWEGLRRTVNWAGFHAAAVLGAAWYLWRERDRRDAVWLAVAVASVAAGWRFFPRYYFLPLAVVCLLGARGLVRMPRWWRAGVLALVLIPVARFAPRHWQLATEGPAGWTDLAMEQDSRIAADLLRERARPGDTLLVWGYRAEIFPYAGLQAGTRFLDSQPLTGVIADRHLRDSKATVPEWAEQNRRELTGRSPEWIVDGLGPYNPELGIERFADLRDWLKRYRQVARTRGTVIYQRADRVGSAAPEPKEPHR